MNDTELFEAARTGDVATLEAVLESNPDRLVVREPPYGWTLLHAAAHSGRLPVVDLLLKRGLDVNVRENGDNTYAMHWAAAAGHLDVVRRLADAGGDVVGAGDDHALEVIGWATGWDGCDDETHRAIADFLVERGAKHNIYSAMSIRDAKEVKRIVAADPGVLSRPMSHNEDFRLPLHFAVNKNLPGMAKLLLELGADPLATDASGYTPAAYATSRDADTPVAEALRDRGQMDLVAALSLEAWDDAERLLGENPASLDDGALHLMSKRNDITAVKWLLAHGADPNARWQHWSAEVTPMHLAALHGHAGVVRLLLDAGADATIHDSEHDSDPLGWADHAGRVDIVRLLRER